MDKVWEVALAANINATARMAMLGIIAFLPSY